METTAMGSALFVVVGYGRRGTDGTGHRASAPRRGPGGVAGSGLRTAKW